jgi:hypothetical protein
VSGSNERLVLFVCSGPRRRNDFGERVEFLCYQAGFAVKVLHVDPCIDPELDLEKESVMQWLRDLISSGCVLGSLQSPPCAVWSKARHRKLKSGVGPRPLRSRETPWVPLPYCTAREIQQHAISSILALCCLELYVLMSLAGGISGFEHPADPGSAPYPSLFVTDHCVYVQALTESIIILLHQCRFGAVSTKPTAMMFNSPLARSLKALCNHKGGHRPLIGQVDGAFRTSFAAAYPPLLNKSLAEVFVQDIVIKNGQVTGGHGGWTSPWANSELPALRATRQHRPVQGGHCRLQQ